MQIDLAEPDQADAEASGAALALRPPPERAALALNTQKTEAALREAVQKHKGITEIKDKAGRDQCHGAAMELMRLRTDLGKVAKEVREDATKFSKAVVAEEDRLVAIVEPEEKRLKALRDAWDKAEEARKAEVARIEAYRKAAIGERITNIKAYRDLAKQSRTSAMVQSLIDKLTALWAGYDIKAQFEEFANDAGVAYLVTLQHMQATLKEKADAEAEAERQRLERERLAEQQRQQEAEAARLAAERAEFERQRAEFEAQQQAARERDERFSAKHSNGTPMYSSTTFKENGDPIMLAPDGKRSIFCDVDDGDEPAAETMVDLGEADVSGVDLASGPDVHVVTPVHATHERAPKAPVAAAMADLNAYEFLTGKPALTDEDVHVAAGFDAAMSAPLPERTEPATDAPPAESIVKVIAEAYGVPRSTAIDWLVIRADEILNLND